MDAGDLNVLGTATGVPKLYLGITTHEVATTGDQAVTGVGFTPRMLVALSNTPSSAKTAIGMSDGVNNYCIHDYQAELADQWGRDSTHLLTLVHATGTYSWATVTSFSTDGFTITWTKNNAPTGTATIYYMAIG